jgi:hypothetical protein
MRRIKEGSVIFKERRREVDRLWNDLDKKKKTKSNAKDDLLIASRPQAVNTHPLTSRVGYLVYATDVELQNHLCRTVSFRELRAVVSFGPSCLCNRSLCPNSIFSGVGDTANFGTKKGCPDVNDGYTPPRHQQLPCNSRESSGRNCNWLFLARGQEYGCASVENGIDKNRPIRTAWQLDLAHVDNVKLKPGY